MTHLLSRVTIFVASIVNAEIIAPSFNAELTQIHRIDAAYRTVSAIRQYVWDSRGLLGIFARNAKTVKSIRSCSEMIRLNFMCRNCKKSYPPQKLE